jgi:Outer membrane protein beta-barrel domain
MKNVFGRRVAVFCLLASFLIVPVSSSFGDDIVTSVGTGSKAFLFTFSGLSDLGAGAYNGGAGFKYFLMDMLALRGSLQAAVASQTLAANGTGADGSISASQFGLSVGGEYHFLKTRVSPYAGAMLGFTTTSTTHKNITPANGIQTTIDDASAGEPTLAGGPFVAGLNFGVSGIGGVEFFIIKELSLSAEYRLGYALTSRYDQKTTSTTTVAPITTTTTTIKTGSYSMFGITAAGALSLAFYF